MLVAGKRIGDGVFAFTSAAWMGAGKMLITSPAAGVFPSGAAWVVVISPEGLAELDGSWGNGRDRAVKTGGAFPVAGQEAVGGGGMTMMRVVWRSKGGGRLRVEAGRCTFEPGPAVVRVFGGGEESGTIAYAAVGRVVADGLGSAGVILSAAKGQEWPEGAKSVQPSSFCVVGVSPEGLQLQVAASLSHFGSAFGGSILIADSHGSTRAYSYESAAAYGGGYVLITAPPSFPFPEDAKYASPPPRASQEGWDADSGTREGGEDADSVPAIIHVSAGGKGDADSGSDSASHLAWATADARLTTSGDAVASVRAASGGRVWSNRGYEWTYLPQELKGLQQLLLPDSVRPAKGDAWDWLGLTLGDSAYVYVLLDETGAPPKGRLPMWLSSGFDQTDMVARTDAPNAGEMVVYRSKGALVGPVRLGDAMAYPSEGARSGYAVMVAPTGVGDGGLQGGGGGGNDGLREAVRQAARAAKLGAQRGREAGRRAAIIGEDTAQFSPLLNRHEQRTLSL